LRVAGDLALDHGDYAAAREHLEAALQLIRALGSDRKVAGCLTDLGHVAKCEHDFSRAEMLFGESIEVARTLDDAAVLAEALLNFGDCLVSKATSSEPRRCVKKASTSIRLCPTISAPDPLYSASDSPSSIRADFHMRATH
jgi:uncharacterized protein HemY